VPIEDPDLSEFTHSNRAGNTCKAFRATELLEEEDRGKYSKALAHPGVTHYSIMEFLKRRGVSMAYETIRRHRNGMCRCEEESA
jgi:hypothetical protein